MTLKKQHLTHFRQLDSRDLDPLLAYLDGLSPETRSRFGPHGYDRQSVIDFYQSPDKFGYVAEDPASDKIIGYSILKQGYLDHDAPRLSSYGLTLSHATDATFAPSLADEWQGKGLGPAFLTYILQHLPSNSISRFILWGGVQVNNERAVAYYRKNNFIILGEFEYFGRNFDMIRNL